MVVQYDQVDGELLQPEILMGEQDLTGQVEVRAVPDREQQDGQVTRESLAPQTRLRSGTRPYRAGTGPLRRTGVD